MGVVGGLLVGAFLMLATAWLLIKGGRPVGPHLALLSEYLPGYSVTILGSLIGFLYGLLFGFLSGYIVGAVYNRIVRR